MFENLTSSLQKIFKNLRGYGKLTEKNVQDAMREIRLALLEADVNFAVARDFIARVKERCLGTDVLDSVTPGQQVTKHVHDELVALLGEGRTEFAWSGKPAQVLLLGLHGAGKTTTAGKLARRWGMEGKSVLLAACDTRRPAAVDQLRILAEQAGAAFAGPLPGERVPEIGRRVLAEAKAAGVEVVLWDTGGRFQMDDQMVAEVDALREATQPENVVLVLDAAIGQESVHVAETFHAALGLTGLILTKLDGDARGGAALSVRAVTGCPILLVGTGERLEGLEPFYPERMAGRILGKGDVVGFVEKAQRAVDQEEMERLEKRFRTDQLDLEDFLAQLQQLRKLGPVENLLEMLPGGDNVSALDKSRMADMSGRELVKSEAIIRSMTPSERRHPHLIDGSRRRRIAKGSGTTVADVNDLLKRYNQAKKMSKRIKKAQKKFLRTGI